MQKSISTTLKQDKIVHISLIQFENLYLCKHPRRNISFACTAQSEDVNDHHRNVNSEMLDGLGVADYAAPASLLTML